MVFGIANLPESFAGLLGSSTQPRRPSVKWDLGSNFDSVAKEPTASGMDFRRERLDSQPDLGVRVQPQIYFLRPRPAVPQLLFSILNSSDANVKKLLPKSHLSRVIIRDNLNAQRIYEMEMKASDKTKRKMSHLYDHLKKKFMTDQLRKMLRWRRESLSTQQYLNRQRERLLNQMSWSSGFGCPFYDVRRVLKIELYCNCITWGQLISAF
ncbi:uncharacterized protein C5orf52 homolog [Alexandromys fortis]|uniref:uncharacterized protein C5orf52 homolog n=1 Tax=Alexandromys fortis TaxID=100897 RepID=UPI0021527E15|nr:uncharacterized protein C5orf52 homolog [Microtus fortis]